MREKLIELLNQCDQKCDETDCYECPYNIIYDCGNPMRADFLIANGVTISPCKVGDTVYALYSRKEYKKRNGSIYRPNAQILTYSHLRSAANQKAVEIREKKCTKSDMNFLGKTVFATKEEAERVAKGG